MDVTKSLATKTYHHFMHDSLRRSSTFLILSQAINGGAAFIFWVICARLFKASTVGLATSFVSFGALVANFTNLGLANTMTRFLPTSKNRGGLFTGSLLLITASSLLGGIIACTLIKIIVPKLGLVQSSYFLMVVLVLIVTLPTISSLLDGILIALKKGEYILVKAVLINLPRLVLPFFVIADGIKGITSTYVVVFTLGVFYSLVFIFRKLLKNENFSPTLLEIRKHYNYAASNYFGGMFAILPTMLVPIIILSKLGPESAAYFYMPIQVVTFLGMISSSISTALISECSQSDDESQNKVHFRNAFSHLYRILIPIIIVLCIAGWPILSIYGGSYAKFGIVPLFILLGTGLLEAINWLGDTWLNIKKQSRAYFLMNAFNALVVIGFVYAFAKHGLIAASLGWLMGQALTTVIYLVVFTSDQLIPINRYLPWLSSK